MAEAFQIVLDDDRVYFFSPSFVTRLVCEDEKMTTEIIPTDDPNTYKVIVTMPTPRFHIKTAEIK